METGVIGLDVSREVGERDFYVSVRDGERVGFLLGPYSTHAEAVENVKRGRKLACEADGRAHWYGFGTCSLAAGDTRRTVFGQ